MINTSKLVFTAALVAAVLGTVPLFGSAPALAQAMSRDASQLPRYYDSEGGMHWGSWGPQTATQTVVPVHGGLYLDAKPIRQHGTPLHKVR